MTNDQIIEMAQDAGFSAMAVRNHSFKLIAFARQIEAATREEDAKLCDAMDHDGVMVAMDCAAAIREMGK